MMCAGVFGLLLAFAKAASLRYQGQTAASDKEPECFHPDTSDKWDQCKACKIESCNLGLKLPDGPEGCQCHYARDGDSGFKADCKNFHGVYMHPDSEWTPCG